MGGRAVGVGVLWIGYTLVWWGWSRLQGEVDLLDLIVPGRAFTQASRAPA